MHKLTCYPMKDHLVGRKLIGSCKELWECSFHNKYATDFASQNSLSRQQSLIFFATANLKTIFHKISCHFATKVCCFAIQYIYTLCLCLPSSGIFLLKGQFNRKQKKVNASTYCWKWLYWMDGFCDKKKLSIDVFTCTERY